MAWFQIESFSFYGRFKIHPCTQSRAVGLGRVVTMCGQPMLPRGCAMRARVAVHRLAMATTALPWLGRYGRTARPPVRSAPDRPCHRCCRWCHCRHRRITTLHAYSCAAPLARLNAVRTWPCRRRLAIDGTAVRGPHRS